MLEHWRRRTQPRLRLMSTFVEFDEKNDEARQDVARALKRINQTNAVRSILGQPAVRNDREEFGEHRNHALPLRPSEAGTSVVKRACLGH